MFKNLKKNKKGFTLIELVVVIAILAILAAIAVPRLLGFQDRARQQADKQTAVQIRNAISLLNANGELALSDNGTYTVAANGTTAVVGINTIPAAAVGGESAAVEALIEGLTENIDPVGTVGIVITVMADGEVTVTTP